MGRNVKIIDCQVLQTSAWSRGMGRYLTALIMGLQKVEPEARLILLFNRSLPFGEDRKNILKIAAPKAELHSIELKKGLSARIEEENSRILDEFISSHKLQSAEFINGSIFSFDYQPAFPSLTKNTLIFYDMIPLKWWHVFHKYFPTEEYGRRFKYVYEVEKIYAISESVRIDLLDLLGIKEDRVVNIKGADIPSFIEDTVKAESNKKVDYRFLLLPGGNSPHKNLLRAIRAFDIFNGEFGDEFKLVITSSYSEENQELMKAMSPNVVLTGNISDTELHRYYTDSEAIIFPSLEEGLGLPILEAVRYGKKVVCSKIPVFDEISKISFYNFDPMNPYEMAAAIRAAIIGEGWVQKSTDYKNILADFSWENSAKLLIGEVSPAVLISDNNTESTDISLIIEQTGGLDSLRRLSPLIEEHYRTHRITLFIDSVYEVEKPEEQLPFIYKYFLPTKDYSDALSKADKNNSSVVLTDRSARTVVIASALGAKIIGSEKDIRAAIKRLSKLYENAEDLTVTLQKIGEQHR